ncbi:Glia maturation factor gamma-like [Oopsacas minuta]|uniref:Glia maturation factor gamma-like n=1 Tax=Oopsacas minuta TaxID=111878 RepID=A0AAV7JCQ9_9METZ|nr:Glia maturation factor gamma-like [Oopsacas minuta]
MAESNLKFCTLGPELKEKLKKFHMRKDKDRAAIVMKINKGKTTVIEDECDFDIADKQKGISIEEIVPELPDNDPRYLAYSYSYQHADGRVTYPLVFIYICPEGAHPEQAMLYAGSLKGIVNEAKFTKTYDLRDAEEMTTEWLNGKLGYK